MTSVLRESQTKLGEPEVLLNPAYAQGVQFSTLDFRWAGADTWSGRLPSHSTAKISSTSVSGIRICSILADRAIAAWQWSQAVRKPPSGKRICVIFQCEALAFVATFRARHL